MSKRRRFTKSAARPVDKRLITVVQSVTSTPTDTTLLDIAFPATLVGLRWALSYGGILTSGVSTIAWAIVIVRDGETVNAMSFSDASDFYTPEQNMLAFGVARMPDADAGAGPTSVPWEGTTKTMRKMAVGDELHIIADGNVASQGQLFGVVQFFTKS